MLPGMSGYRICETIRAVTESLPILILSARSLSEDRTRGFDAGANQYLTKPFDLDELLSRVRNLLRLKQPSQLQPRQTAQEVIDSVAKQIEFGDAKVNFETHEVFGQ